MLWMSRSTRSSTARNGSLHSTVRWAWSFSLRCTQSTVKSRRRSCARRTKSPRSFARVTTDLKIFEAKSIPPQNTRARLRGEFIRRAQERRRDFTVDWVHLKLNDQAQRTVLCKDPFKAVDERVEKLIASM